MGCIMAMDDGMETVNDQVRTRLCLWDQCCCCAGYFKFLVCLTSSVSLCFDVPFLDLEYTTIKEWIANFRISPYSLAIF